MTVKCKSCEYKVGEPTASCGLGCLLQFALFAILTEIMLLVAARLIRKHPLAQTWPLLVLLAALWCLATLYTLFPGYWAKLRYVFTRCPQCGARNWSNGFHSGWGL